MRRLLALLVVAVLVNLPWANQAWVGHRIDTQGRDVEATVVQHSTVRGRYFVQFVLPRSIDAARTKYSGRVDEAHYRTAVATGRIEVRVVPGTPKDNRPAGEQGGGVFTVVAVVGDAILALLAVMVWLRRRRWSRREVIAVDGRLVTFTMGGMTLTADTDAPLTDGLRVGGRLGGRIALRAESDVAPAGPVGELAHLEGAGYRARGRVRDVSRTHTDLLLENGYVLRVLTGEHRNRADLREPAEVTGRLVATPGLD